VKSALMACRARTAARHLVLGKGARLMEERKRVCVGCNHPFLGPGGIKSGGEEGVGPRELEGTRSGLYDFRD